MFGPESRYAEIENAIHVTRDGPPGGDRGGKLSREITYKKRRFLPRGEELPMLTELTVRQGDTLDHLAASTLGNAEQSWRIADANDAMQPRDLLVPDRVLKVPVPRF